MLRIRRSVIFLTSTLVMLLLLVGGLLYIKTRTAGEQLRVFAERTLTRELNLPVHIGGVSLSLGHRSLELRQIAVGDRTSEVPILIIDRALVAFRLTPLLVGKPQVRSLAVYGPRLALTDSPTSRSILTDLLAGTSGISGDRATGGFPVLLEQGAATYRSSATPMGVQVDGLRGRLVWPSPGQALITVAADAMAVRLGTHDVRAVRLEAHGRVTRDGVEVERLSLATDGSSLTFTGVIRTSGRLPQVELTTNGQLAPEDLASLLGGTAWWSGKLSVKGKIVGGALPRTFKASLALEDGAHRLAGRMEARVRSGLLTVEHLSLSRGASRLTASGTMSLTTMAIDLNVNLRGRIEDVAWGLRGDSALAGPIVFGARLTGTPSSLDGVGHLGMPKLRIGTEQIETLQARLAFKGAELTLPSLTARYQGIAFKAEGAIERDGHYRFAVRPLKLEAASIPGLGNIGGRGTLVGRLWGAGQWPERRVEGELAIKDLVFPDLAVGNGTLRFALHENQWRWELHRGQTLRATGVAPLLLSGPLQAEVSATALDLAPLLQAVGAHLPFPLTAHADGRARLRGTLPEFRDLTGSIELAGVRGEAGSVEFGLRAPAHLALEARTLRFDSLELMGPGLSVAVRGSLRPGRRVDLSLIGDIPFGIIRPWLPAVADLQGAPRLQLSLVGEPGAMRVSGRAELAHVQVKPKIVPIWLSVDSGEVAFDNDRVQYTVSQGTAASGRLRGEGRAQRDGGHWRHTLDLRLDKAHLDLIDDELQPERRWVSGDLSTRASLAFETAPNRATLPTLQGRLSMLLEGGSLSHYPALVRLIGLLGAPAQPSRLPDLARERMPYHQITSDITVKDGVMDTTNLLLDSEVMRLTGVGKLDLANQRVDLDLAVRPLQVLEQGIRRIPLLGRLLPQKQSLAVTYFDIEGPWDDPTIAIAPVKSLSQTAVDLLLLLLLSPERVIAPHR